MSTSLPALHLLSASTPVEALHHKSVLSLFGRILNRENLTEKQLILRQMAMKDLSSHSWTALVRKLLWK
jgi:hypothetical protein